MTDNIKQAIAETIANDKSYLDLFEDMTINLKHYMNFSNQHFEN